MEKLYEQITGKIAGQIDQGIYRPGDRLPGVRKLAAQFSVSISTVLQALSMLENNERIEARPRSGYYVRSRVWPPMEAPAISSPPAKPLTVKGWELVHRLLRVNAEPDFVHFGAALPALEFLPSKAVQRAVAAVARRKDRWIAGYAFPPGRIELRRQIARRMLSYGCQVDPEKIIVTNGCYEAYALALRAVAQKGDVIAIESPGYYGLLQVLESYGMKALEIPTDAREGISLPALELALEQWPVKACVLVTNFSNPLGYCMPDAKKRELLELLTSHNVPLIEDDIYGDLGFAGTRPRPARAFDKEGRVLYCSSFSKTISPALRVGWVEAGRYAEQLEYLKYTTNQATPTLTQLAVAGILENGGYERHLRQVRADYKRLVGAMIQAVSKYFPKGTKVTQPDGGFTLWIELPKKVDSLDLFEEALRQRISIAPGPIFSASQKYRNFIRLNCAQPWSGRIETAVMTLGRIAEKLAAAASVKD